MRDCFSSFLNKESLKKNAFWDPRNFLDFWIWRSGGSGRTKWIELFEQTPDAPSSAAVC